MNKKINPKLFWILHISFLRKIISESKGEELKRVTEIGYEIGRRLCDDFCSNFQIFEKIKDNQMEKYLKLFFENYFGNVEVAGNKIKFQNSIAKYQREIGLEFFKTVLETVFEVINENVLFEVKDENLIFYQKLTQSN
jgi:hypothetical protein